MVLSIVNSEIISISKTAQPIPLSGACIICPKFEVKCPAKLTWSPSVPVTSAMAGGPLLRPAIDKEAEDFTLTAPPVTISQDETFAQNLLPRMACGVTGSGAVIFYAVDGRDLSAPGCTLHILGEITHALGCVESVNMDGGSSKRAIIGGKVVDTTSEGVFRGSTGGENKVRPLKSVITF